MKEAAVVSPDAGWVGHSSLQPVQRHSWAPPEVTPFPLQSLQSSHRKPCHFTPQRASFQLADAVAL